MNPWKNTVFKEEKKINIHIKHQVKEHLRTIYLLEDEQIEQIFTTAARTLTDNLSKAESALKDNDYKQLGKAAHSIKGSLLNLGLNDLAQKAKKIEINARENIKIDFQSPLSQLYKNLTELLKKG